MGLAQGEGASRQAQDGPRGQPVVTKGQLASQKLISMGPSRLYDLSVALRVPLDLSGFPQTPWLVESVFTASFPPQGCGVWGGST